MSGSSEAVGSSRSSTSGSFSTAFASETRVRWPADRLPYGRFSSAGEIAVLGDFRDPLARAAQPVEVGEHREVLRDGQPLRQIDVRRREVHPRQHAMPLRRHVLAQHGDAPGARRQHAEQHRQRRRLAGAVAAEQRGRRAGAHRERDALDRFDGAVRLGEIGDDDRGVGSLGQHWIVWRQYCASSLTTVVLSDRHGAPCPRRTPSRA